MKRILTLLGASALVVVAGVATVPTAPLAEAYPSTERIELQVTGRAGVPTDASAVVMNVTATRAEAAGFATIWPCGQPKPEASNLNYEAGQDIPNLVISRIGSGGKVCLEASANTDLIADVSGYFPDGSGYFPIANPLRVSDSRSGFGPIGPDAVTGLTFASGEVVPADATAVVLNVTATGGLAPGFLTVYPCTVSTPDASNLNYIAGQDIPNLVIARLSDNSEVCLFASADVHVIADLAGYFPAGSDYQPTGTPVRILDTRSGVGAPARLTNAEETVELQVTGRDGVPDDARAVVMNVTAGGNANAGFVTVYPCGQSVPDASNLNFTAGGAVPNLVIARPGVDGKVCLFTSASAFLLADIAGYFPADSDFSPAASPTRILDTRTIPAPAPPAAPEPTPAPTPAPTTAPTTTTPTTKPAPQQPPNPGDTKNCSDFATYQEAKAWFDTYFPWYGDVAKLDGDGNGIPCESLPGAP